MADYKNCFMLSLVETHLNSNIYNSELVKEGWSIFRADRCNRSGGGAAIYIKSDFIVTDVSDLQIQICVKQ